MSVAPSMPECLPTRIAAAGRHMDQGEWASGHAIAAAQLRCARGGGCPDRDDCAFAAELMLGDIRRMVAAA